ncbi:ABC transporter permease [Nocardia uniformis]|uniref:Transport permease protein n=2 Tax=Nocardia uniformis TaxID=53432 RepID=A0A849C6Z8_9NOCA|nr:ABC transporter permease [Nocardia uniformis]NNH74444.1 ABC transporter permease [Nocardia uniformis]
MSTATYALADTKTMLRRNLLHAKRYPSMTLSLIIMPIVMLLLFNYIYGGALESSVGGGEYINYLAPSMMLMIPAYVSVGLAVLVATDMTKGIVNRFRSMSISQSSMLNGQVLGTTIQALIGVVFMTLAALVIGFRPNADVLEWLAAFGLITAVIFALSWLAAAFGLVAQNPESASNLPMPIVMLPFLSLVPASTMPVGVKQFVEYQPFTPIGETIRGLLIGAEIGNNGILALLWIAAIAIGGYFWATSQFRRRIN